MGSNAEDLVGMRFGKLTVISRNGSAVKPSGGKVPLWDCSCDCGNTKLVRGENLRDGRTKSCGCTKGKGVKNLIGEKFGRLVVVSRDVSYEQPNGTKIPMWLCKCECGNTCSVRGYSLKNGDTSSCGCLWRESIVESKTKHGLTRRSGQHPLYSVYSNMKNRCYNEKYVDYHNYGGRGIRVCDRWFESFENFYEDMIIDYVEGLTLDRTDVNGNYSPENCRWVNYSVQGFNQRLRKTNTSGKTGVYFDKGSNKWRAVITYQNRAIHLGRFSSKEDAILARESAELEYFGFIKQ